MPILFGGATPYQQQDPNVQAFMQMFGRPPASEIELASFSNQMQGGGDVNQPPGVFSLANTQPVSFDLTSNVSGPMATGGPFQQPNQVQPQPQPPPVTGLGASGAAQELARSRLSGQGSEPARTPSSGGGKVGGRSIGTRAPTQAGALPTAGASGSQGFAALAAQEESQKAGKEAMRRQAIGNIVQASIPAVALIGSLGGTGPLSATGGTAAAGDLTSNVSGPMATGGPFGDQGGGGGVSGQSIANVISGIAGAQAGPQVASAGGGEGIDPYVQQLLRQRALDEAKRKSRFETRFKV